MAPPSTLAVQVEGSKKNTFKLLFLERLYDRTCLILLIDSTQRTLTVFPKKKSNEGSHRLIRIPYENKLEKKINKQMKRKVKMDYLNSTEIGL